MATEVDIQNLYIAYFNRPADKAGLAYWKDANLSILQIAQSFSEQKEYVTAFAGFTAEQTINALYSNLFNHKADADGLAYWSGQIKSGKVSIGAAAIAILNGATGADQMAVQSKNAAAIAFTKKLIADPLADYAYNLGGAAFNTAKSWLAPVVNITSSIDAINSLVSMTEKLTSSAAYGNDKLTGAVLVPVLAGQNNTGKTGDFYFTADDSQLLASNTRLTGNGAAVTLNVNSFFTPVSHSSAVVTGVQTLNLQAGADTTNAGGDFLNSFTTINANRISGGDNIVLGNLSGQTVNLNNQSGTSTVSLGGINQSVTQASAQAGSVVKSTSANLKGARFNFSNTGTGDHTLELTDSSGFKLDRVNMIGLNKIIVRGTDDTNLDVTPSRDLAINLSSSKNVTIAAKGGQNVSISGVKAYGLTLSGNSKFTVENSQFSSIDLYDKGGTLTVKDINTEDHTIYSAVPTKLDMSNGGGGTIKFTGAGSFDITGAGNKPKAYFYEFGASGDINLTTAGTNSVGFYEFLGTGAVTVNLGGTGMLFLGAYSTHSSTTVNVYQPGSNLYITGNGALVNVQETEGKTGDFNLTTSSSTPTNIKLAKTGGGNDKMGIKYSTIETIKTALCTISNFNVTGNDKFATGTGATSLSKISINGSDFASLASNIASSAAAAGQALSATAGQAYLITIGSGEAAGTYLYEHTSKSANTVAGTDVIVKLVGASQFGVADIVDYAY